ncbi:MAG TPA: dienelactone hydrolase family protein [Gemmataceae bacterium]|jgi:predicted peptidase|nr:dienelactone hydrolase family protein [Gemmataceae bacterium]
MRKLFLLTVALAFAGTAAAADTGFIDKTFKGTDGVESKYVLFVPHDYKKGTPTPTILFLHGAGETKAKDGAKQGNMPVNVGIGPAIKKREKSFPFITIIPQAPKFGWGAGSEGGKLALAILDDVEKEYSVDKKRVYLTGLSMGGMGTWSHAVATPDRWAAIVPICGRGDPKQAEKIKDLPCWAFHGDADGSVNVSGSRDMIEAIKKAGGDPKYTEYPKVGHNSWDKAYATDELYEWLLKQSKK